MYNGSSHDPDSSLNEALYSDLVEKFGDKVVFRIQNIKINGVAITLVVTDKAITYLDRNISTPAENAVSLTDYAASQIAPGSEVTIESVSFTVGEIIPTDAADFLKAAGSGKEERANRLALAKSNYQFAFMSQASYDSIFSKTDTAYSVLGVMIGKNEMIELSNRIGQEKALMVASEDVFAGPFSGVAGFVEKARLLGSVFGYISLGLVLLASIPSIYMLKNKVRFKSKSLAAGLGLSLSLTLVVGSLVLYFTAKSVIDNYYGLVLNVWTVWPFLVTALIGVIGGALLSLNYRRQQHVS